MLGPICISKALATGILGGIADGPDDVDILVTSLDAVHTACANHAERSPARHRWMPVLADTGVRDVSAEHLRKTHPSSGVVAATRRPLPPPFRYTRATRSHLPTNKLIPNRSNQ